MSYATPAEMRARIDKSSTSDDTSLQALLDAATLAIDRAVNRWVDDDFEVFNASAQTASARVYTGTGLGWQWIDECVSITLVEVKDSLTDSTYTSWVGSDWLAFTGSIEYPDFNTLPYTGLMCEPGGDYSVFTSGHYGRRDEAFYGIGSVYGSNINYGHRYHGRRTRGVPTVRVTARWGYSASTPQLIKEVCITQASRWWKIDQSAGSIQLASEQFGTLDFRPIDPDLSQMLEKTRYYFPQAGRRF